MIELLAPPGSFSVDHLSSTSDITRERERKRLLFLVVDASSRISETCSNGSTRKILLTWHCWLIRLLVSLCHRNSVVVLFVHVGTRYDVKLSVGDRHLSAIPVSTAQRGPSLSSIRVKSAVPLDAVLRLAARTIAPL